MKRFTILLFLVATAAMAQKPRPDAFDPLPDTLGSKAVVMAATLEEMASWDRYPTYSVYLDMMQHFADTYPDLCHIDTIGRSVTGRLILSLYITGSEPNDLVRPEFFYSSSMHGDEIAGFYLMLRLCDTLLSSYGTSQPITQLLNSTRISINPLSNPDGTYRGGDNTVARAMRYNHNYVDLNRNYPDPFGTDPLDTLQIENQAMINYVSRHNFLLSANIHGGSEVMNYPWDSFTSSQCLNEHSEWWQQVSKRFVDTCRLVDNNRFRDVCSEGYINGGDWYVISNGRQDYFNYYHNLREITIEISTSKTLPNSRLNSYWNCTSHSLINFINEIHHLNNDTVLTIPAPTAPQLIAHPNPTHGPVVIDGLRSTYHFDLSGRPAGLYILRVENHPVKVVKY